MLVSVCDICKNPIASKEEFRFKIGEIEYRFAVLQIKRSNGIRWKEADVCPKCLQKRINKFVDPVPRPSICADCQNDLTKASRYCKMGILKELRKKVCKYKRIK
jgi:hypothetical protein